MPTNKVIFLDTETSGLDFVNDELIQVAAITCDLDNEEIESSINYFFESSVEIPARVTEINGYYKGKWTAEGYCPTSPAACAPLIHEYLTQKDALIFCHNSPFDRAFISSYLSEHGINPLDQPKYFLDTATLAGLFKMKSDWERLSLDYATDKLGIQYTRMAKHDALDDCYLLRQVFFALMKKIHVDKV